MNDIEAGNQSGSGNANLVSETHNAYDEKKNKFELYKAALSNDWKKAETVYKNARMSYGVRVTSIGETALHVAALAGHVNFVQNLVDKMDPGEIRTETEPSESGKGNTAFHCAAISGNVRIAKAILMKANDLAMAKGVANYLPIHMAAKKGNAEMVRYLYDFAYKNHLEALNCRDEDDEDRLTLFLGLVKSRIFDIALHMAQTLLSRPIAPEEMEEEALQELAQIPLNPPGNVNRWFHPFSRRQAVIRQENAVQLVKELWDSLTLSERRVTSFINSPDPNPIHEAAKRGNFTFLSILIATYPDVLFTYDDNKYTIFHHAILNRHVDIFKFIHIGSAKTIVTMYRDHEGNNILHAAAKLAPQNRLSIVPGAALQLQRELLWFEEVKKVMEPHEVDRKNYYLSDFPLRSMLSNIEEIMEVVNKSEGVLEKLKVVMKRQISEFKEYHPSYKDMENSMNQRDVVLLMKKLKKVMEQEYNNFEDRRQLRVMNYLFERISEKICKHDVDQSDTVNVLNEVKAEVARHKWEINSPQRNPMWEIMYQLYQEIVDLMNRYDEQDQHDAELIYKRLKDATERSHWKEFHNYNRVMSDLLQMEGTMEEYEMNNNDKLTEEYTPHDAFAKEHKKLMAEGEKWMRDTANSCMIVAVLITTIAFAAAITVPGGNGDNGYPNFSGEILFKAFAVADSVSMISSAISLLNFLSILTARYTMDDFRWSLPNKLFIGLLTIFISIVAMMVAFILSIYIIFNGNHPVFPILVAAASSVPITMFLWQHSGLCVDVFRSTYASYFLFKPESDPSLVFKRTSISTVQLKKTE